MNEENLQRFDRMVLVALETCSSDEAKQGLTELREWLAGKRQPESRPG